MIYQVAIGDQVVEVDLTGPVPRVDGRSVGAHIEAVPGTPVRHLVTDEGSYTIVARPGRRRGDWHLTFEGRPLMVEALDERTRAIRAMSGGAAGLVEKVVAAPMPGLVVAVHVRPGDTVTAGQGVVAIEAMKMENELRAPADGVVARVEITPGQAVEKGSVLIVLE